MVRWLEAAPAGAVVWLRLEAAPEWKDGDSPERHCALTADWKTASGEIVRRALAHTHPHPRVLHCDDDALATFTRSLRGA
jgi:hypothetical protein